MRTTNDRNTGFNSDLYRKILGFPFLGILLMALCMSFVSCDGDDIEIIELPGIDPYGTYVGTSCKTISSGAEGGHGSVIRPGGSSQLLITKGQSQTRIMLLTENGTVIANKTVEQTNTEKIKELSIEFKSSDGNSTWKVFSDGTNAKFESYDKTQEDGFTKEVTITFEGKKQE